MCTKCGNDCGNTCERVVITKQGERGPQGPPGPQGERGSDGVDGANGADGADGVCPCEQVLATEERLGSGTGGTTPTYALVTGTQHVVGAGKDGDYKITFTAHVLFTAVGAGSLDYKVYVNGAPYGTMFRNHVVNAGSGLEMPTALVISSISLVAGDTIEIQSRSNDNTQTYLNYGTCVIEKIS